METVLVVVVLQAVVSGVLSAVIANSKGKDVLPWFFIGLFFGVLGLIAAVGIGNRPTVPTIAIAGANQKKCPACAEMVMLEAKICRYCHHEFDADEDIRLQKEKENAERERLKREWESYRAVTKKREKILIWVVTIAVLVFFATAYLLLFVFRIAAK